MGGRQANSFESICRATIISNKVGLGWVGLEWVGLV